MLLLHVLHSTMLPTDSVSEIKWPEWAWCARIFEVIDLPVAVWPGSYLCFTIIPQQEFIVHQIITSTYLVCVNYANIFPKKFKSHFYCTFAIYLLRNYYITYYVYLFLISYNIMQCKCIPNNEIPALAQSVTQL